MTHEDRRAVRQAEAELARLLAIHPSSDFAARVRARVVRQRNSRRWHFRWDAAAAAVLVIAVGFIVADVLRAPADTRPPVSAPVISAEAQRGLAVDAPVVPGAVQLPVPVRRTVPRKSGTVVLVPPDAERAMQRVVELAAIGALSAGAAELPGSLTGTPAPPVAPIVVEELDVVDIVVPGDTTEDDVD